MVHEAHVLIVDDDRRIRNLLADYLAGQGYRTSSAANAIDAREKMRGLSFDLMVLDVMMPGERGDSFAASLRAENVGMPILMLSARSDAADRIKGLAAGSDDYLGKPFEPEELLLRVRSLLRRSTPVKSGWVQFGDCKFALDTGELTRDSETIHLTGREKDMLRTLIKGAGKPVPRAILAASGMEDQARAVDVQITRLRQKIEREPANPVHLQTVRGEGYVLFTSREA